jgi:hypothetical protein
MKVLAYKPSFPSLFTRRQSNGCELATIADEVAYEAGVATDEGTAVE